jgi:hypothetical protein
VSGAGSYTSDGYTTTMVGTFRLIAHHSGDVNNALADTTCTDQGDSVAVGKANASIGTQARPSRAAWVKRST